MWSRTGETFSTGYCSQYIKGQAYEGIWSIDPLALSLAENMEARKWADDRRAAVEHARYLKSEQLNEEHTFQPQVNPRPKFLDKRVDSELAALQHRMKVDDVMERPLPATLKRLQDMRSPQASERSPDSLHQQQKKTPSPPKSKLALTPEGLDIPNHKNIRYQFEYSDVSTKDPTLRYGAALRPTPDERTFVGLNWDETTSLNSPSRTKSSMKQGDEEEYESDGQSYEEKSGPTLPRLDKKEVNIAKSKLSLLKTKVKHRPPQVSSSNSLEHSDETMALPYVPLYVAGPILLKGKKVDPSLEIATYPAIDSSEPPSRRILHDETEKLPDLTPRGGENEKVDESTKDGGSGQEDPGPRHVLHDYSEEGQQEVLPYDPIPEPSPIVRRMIIQKTLNDTPGVHYLESEMSRFPVENAEELFLSEGEQRTCPHCSRHFNPKPFAIHEPICQEVFGRKAKKQAKVSPRSPREERYNYHKPKGTAEDRKNNPPAWKMNSEALRDAVRSGKKANVAPGAGEPLPDFIPSKVPSSFVACPHCQRKFNEHAGARHIPQCKTIIAKPSILKKGMGAGGGLSGSSTKNSALGSMR